MQQTSVHDAFVSALRAVIEGRAAIADASTLGTEQVLLLLELDSDTGPGPPAEEDVVASGIEPGRAVLLHLLLIAPAPVFWLAPSSHRRPLAGPFTFGVALRG